MSKKCRAYSDSKLGISQPDNRKAFYAGWDAALRAAPQRKPLTEEDARLIAAAPRSTGGFTSRS